MDLDSIRKKLIKIATKLSNCQKKDALVEGVVAYKKASGKPNFRSQERSSYFEKVRSRVEDKRYQETIVATFSDILKRSRDYQDQNIK